MKYLPDFAPKLDVAFIMISTMTTDSTVSGISRTIIAMSVEINVILELISCGILWLMT